MVPSGKKNKNMKNNKLNSKIFASISLGIFAVFFLAVLGMMFSLDYINGYNTSLAYEESCSNDSNYIYDTSDDFITTVKKR